jgi:hypothetical protein
MHIALAHSVRLVKKGVEESAFPLCLSFSSPLQSTFSETQRGGPGVGFCICILSTAKINISGIKPIRILTITTLEPTACHMRITLDLALPDTITARLKGRGSHVLLT